MDAGTTHKGKVGRLRVKSLHFKFYSAIQFDVFSLAYLYRGDITTFLRSQFSRFSMPPRKTVIRNNRKAQPGLQKT